MSRLDPNRFRWTAIAAVAAMAVYLYYSHLTEPIPSYPDESRVYRFTLWTPTLYWINHFLWRFFPDKYDIPYYALATFGILNICLLYVLARLLFSKSVAVIAAAVFTVYDYPLIYAKQLYYSTQLVTGSLVAMICYTAGVKRNRPMAWAGAGLSCGFMWIAHPSAYAVIIGVVIYGILVMVHEGGIWSLDVNRWKNLAWQGAGFLSVVMAYVALIHIRDPKANYFLFLLNFQSWTQSHFPTGWRAVSQLAADFMDPMKSSLSQSFRNMVLIACSILAVLTAVRQRLTAMLDLWLYAIAGAGIFLLAGLMKGHTLYPRHFVWLSIPVAISTGFVFQKAVREYRNFWRPVVLVVFAAFIVSSAWQCVRITRSVVSYKPIFDYLSKHGIQKKQLLSKLPINRHTDYRSGNLAVLTPVRVIPSQDPERMFGEERLRWDMILFLYRRTEVRYLLTTSIEGNDMVSDEPLLKVSAPIASWPHPRSNTLISGGSAQSKRIELYDLRNIFDKLVPMAESKGREA